MPASAARTVYLVVPGEPDTLTGGYLYDRRIFDGLAERGWKTETLALDPSFPTPSHAALARAEAALARLPDASLVVIDGLALAGLVTLLPGLVERHVPVALIHHPLADETGLDAARAAQLEAAERAALAQVTRVIVTSRWTRRRLADYGVEPARIVVVEPGVDRCAAAAPGRASTVKLLTVATITPRKGHALLVEALARLTDLDWSLRCAGSRDLDPHCAAALAAQIEQAGLSSRNALLGELAPDRVRREYVDADLFVLPSYLEGYGMALAEAIAHGVPVVSTTAGAIPDTLPSAAARLVPPGDVTALTDVLRELIGDAARRSALAEQARAAAPSIPTWPQAIDRFAATLDRYAGR